jgi:hypothetical protein
MAATAEKKMKYIAEARKRLDGVSDWITGGVREVINACG